MYATECSIMALTGGVGMPKIRTDAYPTLCNSGNLPCIRLSLVPRHRSSRGRGTLCPCGGRFLGRFLAYILSLFVLNRFCPCLQVLITEATRKVLVPESPPGRSGEQAFDRLAGHKAGEWLGGRRPNLKGSGSGGSVDDGIQLGRRISSGGDTLTMVCCLRLRYISFSRFVVVSILVACFHNQPFT